MTIFFIFIMIISIIILLLIFSRIIIEIKELELINSKVAEFKIVVSLKLLNRIKWLKFTIDKQKIAKLKSNTKMKFWNKLLNTKKINQFKNKNLRKITNELKKVELRSVKMKLIVGTENPAITALIVGTVSSFLSVILAKITKTPRYNINPIYINKNYLYLSINCIITVKMVHIMNIIKAIKMKGSVPKIWKKIK